jgi:hypothetical protein
MWTIFMAGLSVNIYLMVVLSGITQK